MSATTPPDLVDALALGRLTASEIAGIPPHELDALFEAAALRLDAGRDGDAADLLGALVVLFPYAPRYWRALGIAQHRLGNRVDACLAYDTALVLAGEDDVSRCHRAELYAESGRQDEARRELARLAQGDGAMAPRARDVLALLPSAEPAPLAAQEVTQPTTPLRLQDGRVLPLSPSRYAPLESDVTAPLLPEDTQTTARFFRIAENSVTDVSPFDTLPFESTERRPRPMRRRATATALVARRPRPMGNHPTATALVARGPRPIEPGHDTAQVDRRPAATPTPTPTGVEDTQATAVVRRRLGVPLLDEEA